MIAGTVGRLSTFPPPLLVRRVLDYFAACVPDRFAVVSRTSEMNAKVAFGAGTSPSSTELLETLRP
jgi:hypothetical protein